MPDLPDDGSADEAIVRQEAILRQWFTRGCRPARKLVDGLDIGWGGVQRWATARMCLPRIGLHLDAACGYGTFLAELGWRLPSLRLVGLNIDFMGPHALAKPLLAKAQVGALLVCADARSVPFADATFGSVSCFLGLQDIEIGFGEQGARQAVEEAARVLYPGGWLFLLGEWPWERFEALLAGLPLVVVDRCQQPLDVQWDRRAAHVAVQLYARGWVAQMRLDDRDGRAQQAAYREILHRLEAEVEEQMASKGYYVPFGPVHMVTARRDG